MAAAGLATAVATEDGFVAYGCLQASTAAKTGLALGRRKRAQ